MTDMPQHCVQHKIQEAGIMSRLERLEKDLIELQNRLKDKVDSDFLQEIVERQTREVEELKKSILRLTDADTKHSEALAGIHAILKGFKETQDLLRQDYSKLTDCYTQSSVHIASITAILKERAETVKASPAPGPAAKEEPATMWGTIKQALKDKAIVYSIVGLIVTVIFMLIANQDDIMTMLKALITK